MKNCIRFSWQKRRTPHYFGSASPRHLVQHLLALRVEVREEALRALQPGLRGARRGLRAALPLAPASHGHRDLEKHRLARVSSRRSRIYTLLLEAMERVCGWSPAQLAPPKSKP